MSALIQAVFALGVAAAIITVNLSVWRSPAGGVDRMTLLANCTMLVAFLAFLRVHLPWPAIPLFLWFIGVAGVASAVLGVVLRWTDFPWLREQKPKRQLVDSTVTLFISVIGTVVLSQV